MDNTFYTQDNIVSSSEDESEEENILETRFSNMVKKERYEKYRNKLFTPDIVKKKIVVDSHNYFQADTGFNTSNFDVLFDFERKSGDSSSSLVTTNYDIYNNVIGFKLLKTTIRTPPYNVNNTNNIIRYKVGSDTTIHKITINPGQYEVGELANVFQKYDARYKAEDPTHNNIKEQYSHYVEYTDAGLSTESTGGGNGKGRVDKDSAGLGESMSRSSGVVSRESNPGTFKVTFLNTDETTLNLPSIEGDRELKGLINKFEYFHPASISSPEEITILWDFDNITRGAARLFGFLPKETKTTNNVLFSNRLLDVSSHFVDLVIPEIPSVSCKRNSSGRDIIERIQLRAGHGEYLHYRTAEADLAPVYFNPLKLHRINIQLWAQNNELYDTNNSDVSFEFEITMLKSIDLLR
tara:strand:- start:3592 stop:4818 length:1227 start_codon:yes stop_codon:yes gene_type:complete